MENVVKEKENQQKVLEFEQNKLKAEIEKWACSFEILNLNFNKFFWSKTKEIKDLKEKLLLVNEYDA